MRGPSLARCRGLGCGLHVFPTQRGAHSSSGLQARSWTVGKPSLPLPVPTASGPRRTPSLPAPPLGGLDACRPVRPATSLTGVSTVVSRGRAACCSAGGGHLRGEGEPWAPRHPPPWRLPLCSSRRPTVRGRCGCVRIRPPGSPSPAPVLGIRGLPGADWAPGRVGGLGAGSLGRPQRAAVEGGHPHSQPRAGPCFVPCGGHILVGNGCLVLGTKGKTSRPSWTGAQRVDVCLGPAGQLSGFQSPRTPTWSGHVPAARRLWGCPSLPSPCPGRSDGGPGPCDSPPVSRLQLPLRSVREASWLTTQV